jgi:hypothetical protein
MAKVTTKGPQNDLILKSVSFFKTRRIFFKDSKRFGKLEIVRLEKEFGELKMEKRKIEKAKKIKAFVKLTFHLQSFDTNKQQSHSS